MKKDLGVIFGLFLAVLLLLVFGRGFTTLAPIKSNSSSQSASVTKTTTTLKAKSLSIEAQIASTPDQRKKGLSKQDSLPMDKGILFVFDSEDKWAIWMKDMEFAIDIIWLDKDKKIVGIAKNVSPEPDKKDRELTIYKPDNYALYVVEINAGLTDRYELMDGDQFEFEL